MNLNPEQKAIGTRNFQAAIGSEFTRRDFLMGSIAAGVASGAGLGAFYYGYDKSIGDPVRVGIIGTGDEGGVLIGAISPDYVQVKAIADIRPYNVHRAFHGDMSALHVRPGLIAKYEYSDEDKARENIKVYDQDYKDLLNDDDIEGVIIALPLHLHDKVAIEAMLAGKHVLTEKLMAHSVHQCKNMGRVARREKKILATGHQRHYSILYDNAVAMIKKGLLGDLHHIRAQWHRGNLPGSDSWRPPLPTDDDLGKYLAGRRKSLKETEERLPTLSGSAKASQLKRMEDLSVQIQKAELQMLDRDVDAAKYGYEQKILKSGETTYECSPLEELIRWRLWDRTGGGLMAELGSHQLDAAGIFCSALREDGKKAQPLSVTGVGGRHIFPLDRECDDHVYCMFEFPGPGYDATTAPEKKIVVTYSSINGNGFGGYGETVLGTEGTLILEREQNAMLFKGSSTMTKVSVEAKGGGAALSTTDSGEMSVAVGQDATKEISRGYTEEMEHWAWCLRNFQPEGDYAEQPQPKCKPEVALADAVIALTSNIALAEGRKIDFDPAWFDIDSDATPEGVAPSEPV